MTDEHTLAVKPSKCLEVSAIKLTTIELDSDLNIGKCAVKFPQTRPSRLSRMADSPS